MHVKTTFWLSYLTSSESGSAVTASSTGSVNMEKEDQQIHFLILRKQAWIGVLNTVYEMLKVTSVTQKTGKCTHGSI